VLRTTISNGVIYGAKRQNLPKLTPWTGVAEHFSLFGATNWKSTLPKIPPVKFYSEKDGPPPDFKNGLL
jgi:hypothetical protein